MTKYLFCLTWALMLAGAGTLTAAEPAKRGVDARSAARLEQIARANSAKRHGERARQLQQAAQATFDQLKSERAAYDTALAKQPEYAQFKRDYDALAAFAKDSNVSKDPRLQKELRERTRAFGAKYDAVQLRAYQQARVDDRRVRAVIAANFARAIPAAKIEKVGLFWILRLAEQPSAEPLPSSCVQPPYESDYERTDTELIGNAAATADKANGDIEVFAAAVVAGSASVSAGVGDNFTIPAGSHEVRVTAAIPAEHWLGSNALGGGSWAGVELETVVTSLNTGTSTSHRIEVAYLATPIVGIALSKGSDDHLVISSFSLSGGEHLVEAGTVAYVGGAGIALARSDLSGTVNEICVEVLD